MTVLDLQDGRSTTAPTGGLVCRIAAELPPLGLGARERLPRGGIYQLSPRRGPLRFTADYLGLASGSGIARHYTGHLALQPGEPAIAGIDLTVEPDGVGVAWQEAAFGMYPGAPVTPIRFRSTAVEPAGSRRWKLRGLLEIGSTPRLQTMDVALVERSIDAITGTDVASYELSGSLSPASFGLVSACTWFTLTLRLRVELDNRG